MNYQKISRQLQKLENDFYLALKNFEDDKMFHSKKEVYLKEDKNNLYEKWHKIGKIFFELKKIIGKSGTGYIFFRNYNNFVIKRYSIILYYNLAARLHESFKEHEDFIRQYLDENYKENYSTIARYIYRAKFLYFLNYPYQFLSLIKNKLDTNIVWMLDEKIDYILKPDFDYKNFYYYFKFRIDKIIRLIVKYFGRFLAKIVLKSDEKGLIDEKCIIEFYKIVKPGDILLSRQNFVATNLSIPGFWKHMSMYIGTGKYLKENFPIQAFKGLQDNIHYIIESTGKGVKINDFEDFSYKLDYIGVFRTSFSQNKIFNAIINASKSLDLEYDYLFNYYSDQSFVCSELITKAYLKDFPDDEGLNIHLEKIASGLTYPPNNFAKKAQEENEMKDKDIYPVLFIDSNVSEKKSFINSNEELLKSYSRSRLSFFLK